MPPRGRSCNNHLKEYCAQCSFTGFRYIADGKRHWTERLLWVVLIALCWYGAALLVLSAYESFESSPISFGVETNYIEWSTSLPSIAVCETKSNRKIFDAMDKYEKAKEDISAMLHFPTEPLDLADILGELAFFEGFLYNTLDQCVKYDVKTYCPLGNFSRTADLVRSPCHELMSDCFYNENEFDCCLYFQHLKTDIGSCYAINSVQTEEPLPYPMVNNRTHRNGVLRFNLHSPAKVYYLSEDEVPTVTTSKSSSLMTKTGYRYRLSLSVRSIVNDRQVASTTPAQRACLFPREGAVAYPAYSYSACVVDCRRAAQLLHCGCNDHYMPGAAEEQLCNMSGLACLAGRSSQLTTLRPAWAARPGLVCPCLPACGEREITPVTSDEQPDRELKKAKKSSVEIRLASLPTERFKRSVVRSRLDLVVSIGGTISLFLGASILSFVELLFYFTIRYFSTYYAANKQTPANPTTFAQQRL